MGGCHLDQFLAQTYWLLSKSKDLVTQFLEMYDPYWRMSQHTMNTDKA